MQINYIPRNLGNSKNKVGELNVNKSVPAPVGIGKLSDVLKKSCC